MKSGKKTVVLPELNRFTLFFVPFFKAINISDIYYLEVGKYFAKRPHLIPYFEKKGIRWIKKEYEAFSDYEAGYPLARVFVDTVFEKLDSSHIFCEIDRYFQVTSSFEKKMNVVWKYNISLFVELMAHQYAAAEYLINKLQYRHVVLLSFCSMAHLVADIVEKNRNIKIVYPPLASFWLIISKICERIFSEGHRGSVFTLRKGKIANKDNGGNFGMRQPIDIGRFEIAFFPHMGVFYGNLFIKDHFYSDNIGSSFHKSKILHISLNEKQETFLHKSYRYYDHHNIPYIDSEDFSCSNKEILCCLYQQLLRRPKRVLKEVFQFGLDSLLIESAVFYKMYKYRYFVSQLKNLRIGLVGYDFLFPVELSLVLALKGAKTCATQERFLLAFHSLTKSYIFDYYFTAGDVVKDRGLKYCQIEKCIPVGLVRVDRLYEYEKAQIPDKKYDKIKESKKLVLALDYHLPENDLEDTSRSVAKVSQTRQFYRDLINLAVEFPDIYIVIKGKMVENYNSHYIKDIVSKISRMENMGIELDLDQYNPYFLAEKADLTIACHTSLADELLAAGRKVMFYEATDFLKANFDYDDLPIIVTDYEGLRYNVQNFLNGIYLDENRINELKSFYSDCYHGKIKEQIHSILEQTIHQ